MKANHNAVAALVFNCLLGAVGLYFEVENYIAINIIAISSWLSFLLCLIASKENLLYLSRLLLLGVIGYFPILIKAIDISAYFSGYESASQSLTIVLVMNLCTTLGLLGSYWGFLLADSLTYKPRVCFEWHEEVEVTALFAVGCVLSIGVAAYMGSLSLTVFSAQYGEGAIGESPVGNLNSILNIGLFLVLMTYLKVPSVAKSFLLIFVFMFAFVYAQVLKGARQDVMSAMFSFYVIYKLVGRQRAIFTWRIFAIALPIIVAFDIWGSIRGQLYDSSFSVELGKALSFSFGEGGVYHAGTISPIASTFANTIMLVQDGLLDWKLGSTYFDYILRSPPEFLYPDRPRDYAWIFFDFGMSSGGGFFELAEAYLNFGIVGALVMPFVLSFIIGVIYNKAFFQQKLIDYFFMFGFLAIWLRGSWYQTFAFYKAWLTSIILYALVVSFLRRFRRHRLDLSKVG